MKREQTAIRDNAYGKNGRRHNYIDMTGVRVGHLVVVREAMNIDGRPRWACRCDCGRDFIIEGVHLRSAQKRGSTEYSCPVCRWERIREMRKRRREASDGS